MWCCSINYTLDLDVIMMAVQKQHQETTLRHFPYTQLHMLLFE